MTLLRFHRLNACVLGLFIALHLINHSLFVLGFETHLTVMTGLRHLYRVPIIEIPLLVLFASQIVLGLALAWKRGRPQGKWAWAQVVSGGYLALFLLQHLGATLSTRMFYADIDTNSFWAASVVSQQPFVSYFAPYYALAVLAIFTHIAAALRFRNWARPATFKQKALPVIGAVLGITSVGAMILHSQTGLPPNYQAYLDNFWGT